MPDQREPVFIIMPSKARSAAISALYANLDEHIRKQTPAPDFIAALRSAINAVVNSFPESHRALVREAGVEAYPALRSELK